MSFDSNRIFLCFAGGAKESAEGMAEAENITNQAIYPSSGLFRVFGRVSLGRVSLQRFTFHTFTISSQSRTLVSSLSPLVLVMSPQ